MRNLPCAVLFRCYLLSHNSIPLLATRTQYNAYRMLLPSASPDDSQSQKETRLETICFTFLLRSISAVIASELVAADVFRTKFAPNPRNTSILSYYTRSSKLMINQSLFISSPVRNAQAPQAIAVLTEKGYG